MNKKLYLILLLLVLTLSPLTSQASQPNDTVYFPLVGGVDDWPMQSSQFHGSADTGAYGVELDYGEPMIIHLGTCHGGWSGYRLDNWPDNWYEWAGDEADSQQSTMDYEVEIRNVCN